MIELTKEKSFSAKDPKLNHQKGGMFDKFRVTKFSSCAVSPVTNDSKIIIYLGLTSGNIVALTIYKQKAKFYKYEDFTLYKASDQCKHTGPVNCMICELIENVPMLFTGGFDGYINLWQGEPELREKDMNHYIPTNLKMDRNKHNGTVMALAFSRTRSILISSSSDMTMKIFKMKDKFDKILNPFFECISVIKDYHIQLNKDRDLPYYITTLSIKESDIIELYAGDTKGRILIYHYIDDNYLKYKGKDSDELFKSTHVKNNFNYMRDINLHRKWGTIKVVHSIFDSVIYSAGYDNHIVCFNVKNNTKTFEVTNSISKTHFSSLSVNYLTQELIVGDHVGNITFIKIFNKAEFKIKAMTNKIISLNSLEIFNEQEHIFVVSEDYITLFKINRKTKVSNVQHHEAELINLITIEPIKEGVKILEDAKLISTAYDNKIKVWDFLTMECINLINGPELSKKNIEISNICYLPDSALIAVGTDIGNIFFWDLNRSEYIKNSYEDNARRHKSKVTGLISFIITGKDNSYIESLITCSSDGVIMRWEIQKNEIRETRRMDINEDIDGNNEYLNKQNDEKKQKMKEILNEIKYTNEKDDKDEKDDPNSDNLFKRRPIKNYKCIPEIKLIINTMITLKQEIKFTCVNHSQMNFNKNIYAGTEDGKIYAFEFEKGTKIDSVASSNKYISCMIFDKNFLITGGLEGIIDFWTISKENKGIPERLYSLTDPDVSPNCNVRIHSILMLSKIGILVSSTNTKKVRLWKYESKDLLSSISKEQEITCMTVVESYGKLICGTKEKTIIEIDLADNLDKINYKHDYEKYPFLKNSVNYIENDADKKIKNKDIMDSLNDDMDVFKY